MSSPESAPIERLQENLLQIVAKWQPPITPAIQAAFRAEPRHAFVKRFLWNEKMTDVTPDNLSQLLPVLYQNTPLTLWKDPEKRLWSTISQPTFVLLMLRILEVAEGQKVFELGTGSGWNAAMMGRLVGPTGRVTSLEIIPEIAEAAHAVMAERGIANVDIVTADAGDGWATGGPYDRVMFTAGSYDLPRAFFQQVREGGLLLMVASVEGGGDQLVLLEKKVDHFVSRTGFSCSFVPMIGRHAFAAAWPILIESLPGWEELKQREVERRPFWWGVAEGAQHWITTPVRSFFTVAEPKLRIFHEDVKEAMEPQHWYFGVFEPEAHSLVVARKGELISYGNVAARDRLLARLHEWIDLGMPNMTAMDLWIYPIGTEIPPEPNQWTVRRTHATFVWKLKSAPAAPKPEN